MLKTTVAPALRTLEIFTAPAAEALLGSVMNEVTAALRGAVV